LLGYSVHPLLPIIATLQDEDQEEDETAFLKHRVTKQRTGERWGADFGFWQPFSPLCTDRL
jgi:hypothetical protein